MGSVGADSHRWCIDPLPSFAWCAAAYGTANYSEDASSALARSRSRGTVG
jgi:hypothetical protein